MTATCPLCECAALRPFATAHGRDWLRCGTCLLTIMEPSQRLGTEEERQHYGTHQNDPHDAGYRRFLGRLAKPLVEQLHPGAHGLDYGAGPGPTLSLMLEEQGFRMSLWDPFFAPDDAALGRTYDFITATEVVEHFHSPRMEFDRLDGMLRHGGVLAVMTELMQPDRDITSWRYARDPTHVSLFAPATLQWIAGHYGWTLHTPQANVALFRKPEAARAPE